MRRVAVLLATAAGAGFSPIAPGTAGSVVGVLIYWFTRHWPLSWQAALIVAITAVGVWASTLAATHFNKKDPGQVVIDEVAGQLVTLFAIGAGVRGALVGFLLFRALDIVKPPPARQFEQLPGGWGIMADDVMAGIYGNVILILLGRIATLSA